MAGGGRLAITIGGRLAITIGGKWEVGHKIDGRWEVGHNNWQEVGGWP